MKTKIEILDIIHFILECGGDPDQFLSLLNRKNRT
jgi:hypothetical protein